jgi:hypothetical protein
LFTQGLPRNIVATSNPGVNDDINAGYNVGSIWVNVSTDAIYFCADAADGAAVWALTASATLTEITSLSDSDGNFIVGNGSAWVAESGATVRTSIGVGTGNSPQFTGIELGHASDTTIVRSGSGDITIEGNAVYRAGGTDVAVVDGGTGASSLTNLITLGTHTTGNYVGTITGGTGLDSTGATSGEGIAHTLSIDLNEVTEAAIANGDYIPFMDATDSSATKKEALADIATLFAGTGLTASSSVLGVDASQTQITSVGALNAGSITSGFTSIDVGAGAIAGGSFDASDGNITNVGDIALDSISADDTDISIAVTDNSATALTVLQGSDAYLIIDTANGSESVSIGTGISGTAIAIGHSVSEVTFGDNVTITGDFTVNGTTTTIATTNLTVTDPLVKYGQGYTASAYDQGFIVTRGDGAGSSNTQNMAFIWDESEDEFATIKAATEAGTTAGNVTVTDHVNLHVGALVANDTSTFSGSIELGHASDTTIARSGSGDITIEGNAVYRAGGTDVAVADGGTGASSLANLITLATHTTGDFVGTVTAGTGLTSTGGTSGEDVDHSLSVDAAQTQITSLGAQIATFTVGVNGTGHDVKFFGDASGAYMEWDADTDTLRLLGATADAAGSSGKLLLATAQVGVAADDILGQIDFQAPLETQGGDGALVTASIQAVAEATFTATVNNTNLIFKTADDGAATEKFRMTHDGELGIGGANYGTSGQVLTSGGADAAVSWETPTVGDITGVTAGVGLSGGGTTGALTLTLDLSELSTVTPADGDFFSTLDSDGSTEQKTTTTALATLLAGTGLTASSSVIGVDAAQTQITSVGDLGGGTIAATFGVIDNGTSGIRTNTFTAETSIIPSGVGTADIGSTSAEWGDVFIADDKAIKFGNGQDATIEYDEDGTDQLRISGNTVFANQVESTLDIMLDSSPADETASGITATFTAGEDLVRGEVVYFKAGDSKMWKALATAAATSRCVAMAAADISADAAGLFLLRGFLADNGSFPGYTIAGVLYTPEAESNPGDGSSQNVPEQAAPDTAGDFVQVLGWAVTANSVYFDPDSTVIEVG